MTKSLRATVLIASALAGCWGASPGDPVRRGPATTPAPVAPASSSREVCAESGERLVLVVCRRGDALDWTVTNATNEELWAFVAMPAGRIGARDRANVIVRAKDGHVQLSKLQLGQIGGEAVFTGAVALGPGSSEQGRIPLGSEIDRAAENFSGIALSGTARIREVSLEVGFATKQPGDRFEAKQDALFIVTNFARSRQELVRSPFVPWE